MKSKKTYREVIASNNGEPLEFKVLTKDGLWMKAGCWTDDPDVMDWDATFDVITEWGEIGRFDNMHGELDGQLDELKKMIEGRVGGVWQFGDNCFSQEG